MNRPDKLNEIPEKSTAPDIILKAIDNLQQDDVEWQDGKAWSLVYYASKEHDALLKAAAEKSFSLNYLNPFAFKSLQSMEQDVVRMTISMLHGNSSAVGVMTSGGTESILLAMLTYRQIAEKTHPHIKLPEVVAPSTIHPAFDKAALLFGIRLRKAPVDNSFRAVPEAMEKLITANTISLVASAPSYPNGILDPIDDIAALAVKYKLPMHVDACIGGFMLPWLESLGRSLPQWDFRVEGVTSISADVHKFGFGAKGASVIAYSGMDYMRHQFVLTTDFPGGIYVSPTLLGTRPGGPIAAAWAGMQHFGKEGYMAMARKLMDATDKLKAALVAIPGISILGDPCMNIISFTTSKNKPDIFVIAEQLQEKGWMVDRQQLPDCIHLTVLPTNVSVIEQYIADLKKAIQFAHENPAETAKGNAAIYGLMARVPFRGMVEKNVMKIMEAMYTGKQPVEEGESIGMNRQLMTRQPAWIGMMNRLLLFLKRLKSK